jgi:hypothetical protein
MVEAVLKLAAVVLEEVRVQDKLEDYSLVDLALVEALVAAEAAITAVAEQDKVL